MKALRKIPISIGFVQIPELELFHAKTTDKLDLKSLCSCGSRPKMRIACPHCQEEYTSWQKVPNRGYPISKSEFITFSQEEMESENTMSRQLHSEDQPTPMQEQGCQKATRRQQHQHQEATGSGGEGKGETAPAGIESRHHRPSPDTLSSYCPRCGRSPLRSDRSRRAGYCGMCLRDDPTLPRSGYVPPEVRVEGYWRNYLARMGELG